MPNTNDPIGAFKFLVEIGVTNEIVGGCSEVTGLNVEINTEDYSEGGENSFIHKLPGRVKTEKITLKRGMTDNAYLWNWMREVSQGTVNRKNVTLILQDPEGNKKWSWTCQNAYPTKWAGPTLSAQGSNIAFESLELVHKGIIKS